MSDVKKKTILTPNLEFMKNQQQTSTRPVLLEMISHRTPKTTDSIQIAYDFELFMKNIEFFFSNLFRIMWKIREKYEKWICIMWPVYLSATAGFNLIKSSLCFKMFGNFSVSSTNRLFSSLVSAEMNIDAFCKYHRNDSTLAFTIFISAFCKNIQKCSDGLQWQVKKMKWDLFIWWIENPIYLWSLIQNRGECVRTENIEIVAIASYMSP